MASQSSVLRLRGLRRPCGALRAPVLSASPSRPFTAFARAESARDQRQPPHALLDNTSRPALQFRCSRTTIRSRKKKASRDAKKPWFDESGPYWFHARQMPEADKAAELAALRPAAPEPENEAAPSPDQLMSPESTALAIERRAEHFRQLPVELQKMRLDYEYRSLERHTTPMPASPPMVVHHKQRESEQRPPIFWDPVHPLEGLPADAAPPSAFAVFSLKGGRSLKGKQYKVSVGDRIMTPLWVLPRLYLPAIEEEIVFNDVLVVGSPDTTVIGRPVIVGARVRAVVEEHTPTKTKIVLKHKKRKRYRKMSEVNPMVTVMRIVGIDFDFEAIPKDYEVLDSSLEIQTDLNSALLAREQSAEHSVDELAGTDGDEEHEELTKEELLFLEEHRDAYDRICALEVEHAATARIAASEWESETV